MVIIGYHSFELHRVQRLVLNFLHSHLKASNLRVKVCIAGQSHNVSLHIWVHFWAIRHHFKNYFTGLKSVHYWHLKVHNDQLVDGVWTVFIVAFFLEKRFVDLNGLSSV